MIEITKYMFRVCQNVANIIVSSLNKLPTRVLEGWF